MLPTHGPISCTSCFTNDLVIWDKTKKVFGKGNPPQWQLENNPCAWGSQNPKYIVLGFSKGSNQNLSGKIFDEVAFSGMRKQLSRILNMLELLPDNEDISSHIAKKEQDWAFGSLIRCSISQWHDSKQSYAKSGSNILVNAVNDYHASKIVGACIKNYLYPLPSNTKVIIMLGNNKKYIDSCFRSFKSYYRDLIKINDVSYRTDTVTWIHTVHAKAQGKHIPNWLSESRYSEQGYKGILAKQAASLCYDNYD